MTKVLTYSKLAMKFAKGICGLRKKEYDLQFVYEPDDNLWYIDMHGQHGKEACVLQ